MSSVDPLYGFFPWLAGQALPLAAAVPAVAGWMSRRRSFADKILCAATGAIALKLAILLLLAAIGRGFGPGNILAACAGVAAWGAWRARRKTGPWKKTVQFFAESPEALGRMFRETHWTSFAPLAAAGTFLLFLTLFALLSPPLPYDSYTYHLYFAHSWLLSGSLAPVGHPALDLQAPFMPANGELLALWNIALFGSDLPANFSQIAAALLGGLALYSLARKLGAPRQWALAAPAIFVSVPGLAYQLTSCDVDVWFAAFFFLSANFFLPDPEDRDAPFDWRPALTALGLWTGTKSLSLLYLPCLAILAAPLLLHKRTWPRPLELAVGLACFFAAGGWWFARNILFLGSPTWPVELSVGGLTVFPGLISLSSVAQGVFKAGPESLKETLDAIVGLPWAVFFFHSLFLKALGAFRSPRPGVVGFWIALAAALCVAPFLWGRTDFWKAAGPWIAEAFLAADLAIAVVLFAFKKERWAAVWMWTLGSAVFFLHWKLNPSNYSHNARFLFVSLLSVGLTWIVFAARSGVSSRLALPVLALLPGVGLALDRDVFSIVKRTFNAMIGVSRGERAEEAQAIFWSFVFLLAVLAVCLALAARFKTRRALCLFCAAAAALGFGLGPFPLASDFYGATRCYWFDTPQKQALYEFVNSYKGKGKTIAFAGLDTPYGLTGRRQENRVLFIKTNARQGAPLADLHRQTLSSQGAPPADVDYEEMRKLPFYKNADEKIWLSNLAESKTDWVILKTPEAAVEEEWISANPRRFRLIYNSGGYMAFQFAP